MKKLFVLTIALVLVVGSASFVLAQNISQFCTENNDFGVKHGTCVSTFQACTDSEGLTVTPLCICKFLRAGWPTEYRGIVGNNGLGACVQFIRDLLP